MKQYSNLSFISNGHSIFSSCSHYSHTLSRMNKSSSGAPNQLWIGTKNINLNLFEKEKRTKFVNVWMDSGYLCCDEFFLYMQSFQKKLAWLQLCYVFERNRFILTCVQIRIFNYDDLSLQKLHESVTQLHNLGTR